MKIIEAKKLNNLLKELESYESDLEKIKNTKEFTTVTFDGEDGAERANGFSLGWKRNSNDNQRYRIAKAIHQLAIKRLEEEIKRVIEEIEKL